MSIKVLKEAFCVNDDAEGAEFDYLEEANIGKMDYLFETELETSDKEAENYKCGICQKMYIDNTELIEHMELCDVEENKESEEDRENVCCPYCQKLFINSKEVLKHMGNSCRSGRGPIFIPNIVKSLLSVLFSGLK